MLSALLLVARHGISHTKVQPGMVLHAVKAIYQTIYGRDGTIHDILFAEEGDTVRVEAPDQYRGNHQYTCTNLSSHEEIGSIPVADLEDTFLEYS